MNTVLIVIDEASALLDQAENRRFRSFRNALFLEKQALAQHGIIFALVDTNSQIANLSPPLAAVFDNSSRPWENDFLPLPPFWEINPPLSIDSVKPSMSIRAHLTHGRPLWNALGLTGGALIEFGGKKLFSSVAAFPLNQRSALFPSPYVLSCSIFL